MSATYLYDPPDLDNLRRSRVAQSANSGKYPPTAISHLPGVGKYALDSYRIFSPSLPGGGAPAKEQERLALVKRMNEELDSVEIDSEEWRDVLPDDKELRRYLVSFSCLMVAGDVLTLLDLEMGS